MPYNRIKWLILSIPTITIALWEYVRHAFLLPYISMDLGNLLAPIIVLLVTVTLVRMLMGMLEKVHKSLQQERAVKAGLMEREQLARELHDGISQSLFLLSVKLDRLEQETAGGQAAETVTQLRSTVRHVYEDVRQSIASLRTEPAVADVQWIQAVKQMADDFARIGLPVQVDWRLPDAMLTNKEKVELLAIIREAMFNVQKHARASRMKVRAAAEDGGFRCSVVDDGIGANLTELGAKGRYGVRMMKDRASAMGWRLDIAPASGEDGMNGLAVEVTKEGSGR
ncbi:sensor histidine kinase [Paenibacillus mendelii]|uniref:histidine kinase n=1 Tax=Paenibacillus mendelii TaxID=206163 RepID=A0ABV6J8Q8_9BACL|nr:histidine kinase [Paenibacillus mendelii]MCQ6559613.1 histidine kinase [Paenibacillus mendelii]